MALYRVDAFTAWRYTLVLFVLLAAARTSHTFASCADSELAQNASVVLSWTLHSGSETFTRISHTTEVLAASGSARLTIIGGIEYESAQPVVTNPLLVYDVQTNAFLKPRDVILSSLTPATAASPSKRVVDDKFTSPASRVDHASFAHTGVVYVFGGQNKEFLNDTWRLCLDNSAATATWDQLVASTDAVTRAATPVPRIGHSFTRVFENATTIGALVFGGVSESYLELDALHMALITKAPAGGCSTRSPRIVWRMLQSTAAAARDGVPAPRAYHAAVATSALFSPAKTVCLLVHGGKSAQFGLIFDELWRLCPPPPDGLTPLPVEQQVHVWELLAPLGTTPGARYGASVVFVDEGKAALAGGSYTFPNDFLSDAWELNVNATQWVRLRFDADFAPPRRGHTLAFVAASSTLWIFGGKDRYAVVQKRIESTRYTAPFCATGLRITLCDTTGEYVCEPCPAGQFLQIGTRNCLPCAQGSFSSAGAAECTLCPAGTYSTVIGKTSATPCTQCPTGTASSTLGAVALTACLACPAGTFAPTTGSTVCTSCAPGAYSNASAAVCALCRPGEWSAAGDATCRSCAAGTFASMNGSATCFACPKGLFSTSGADACLPCPRNTSSNSIGAASAGCKPCPALSFTPAAGQTRCQVCSPGSSLVNGICQPCAKGSFASEITGGACLPCPVGSYASQPGATQCVTCPTGATTATPGASVLADCVFCALGSYFTGSSCAACAPGSYASSTGFCSKCAPGSYASSAASSDCTQCAAMTIAGDIGSTRCAACLDGTFALTGWRSCVACGLSESQLLGCKLGRNSVMCSGNGRCVYGGCACSDGWTAADCSAPVSSAAVSASTAVLYFPSSQMQLAEAPITKSDDEIAVVIARSGLSASALTGLVHWTASNFSATPPGFPMAITLAAGVLTKTISVPVAALTPRTGCRFFTLTLRDATIGATPSAVSVDSDRSITMFLDDMNGVAGGGASPRSLTASYSYASNTSAIATADVTLDRVATSQLTFAPSTTLGSSSALLLQNQHMNVLVAFDRSSSSSVVNLLPAVVAQLQTRYTLEPDGIRFGLLVGNTSSAAAPPSATFYASTSEFFAATRQLLDAASAQQKALSWDWMAAALTRNASAWPATGRRFLWVLDFNQLSLSPTAPSTAALAFQTAARAQSVFSMVVQPPAASSLSRGNTATFTGVEDLVQRVVYDSVMLLPAALLQAHQARDTSLPARVDVLDDVSSLVTSCQVQAFASGASSLPVLRVLFTSFPVAGSSSSSTAATANVTLSVPGLLQLKVRITAPSHACSPPVDVPPADPQIFSGWMEQWTAASRTEIQRQWYSVSSSLELQLYDDASLLRSATSTVLAMRDTLRTRMTLTRALAGLDFSAGLTLVLRGYMRSASADPTATASCQQRITMVAANGTTDAAIMHSSSLSHGEWRYGWLQRVVPWDLDAVNVTLDCNTSAPGVTVEWTTLGLLPDPSFACKCPRGFFNDALNSADNATDDGGECVRCPAGSYCAAGIKRRCPTGSFSFGKAPSCEPCRDGWICVDGLARLCTPGTYATPAFTCAVCPAGSACRNGKRSNCRAGTFSRPQASDCESCPPGTISRFDGSSTCERCTLHQTSNYQRDHCVACSAGEQTAHTAQHMCASCPATAFPSRRALEQCVA